LRDRPFLTASESPRAFSEIRAERGDTDLRERTLRDVAGLEAEAQACDDDAERRRLQGEAEALRCALYHQPRR
jgi:hypothetical protein